MKTQVTAGEGSQQISIHREFELPVALLFKAYVEPALFEQWMGTKLLKFDCVPHGSYRFETSNPQGTVVFSANGTFHEVIPNRRITRTFEMENTPFPAQLEFLEFEELAPDRSLLNMEIIFKSANFRDQLLRMPFAGGLSMAHDRLQDLFTPQPPQT